MNGNIASCSAKVAANTNTTNSTAATVKKLDTRTGAIESEVKSLARRMLEYETVPKGGGKGRTKGPTVFNMASGELIPGGMPDPLPDAWINSARVNRAAGLGFLPEARQNQEDSWAAYNANNANNETSTDAQRVPPSEFALAARPGDRTGLVFGGFKADTDREEIECRLRQIVHGWEKGWRASGPWASLRSRAKSRS
jgi:hypothetical protein